MNKEYNQYAIFKETGEGNQRRWDRVKDVLIKAQNYQKVAYRIKYPYVILPIGLWR